MNRLKTNQRGVASIIIVVIIITIVTLITLGFSAVIRREQRQTLDQQLSAQARYAAESAINKAIAQLRQNPDSFTEDSTCESSPLPTFTGASEIVTTCLEINRTPGGLIFDNVNQDSTVVWLDPNGQPLQDIYITWQTTDPDHNDCSTTAYKDMPTNLGGNKIGFIRFDLTRVGVDGASFSRNDLRTNSFGGVLYPKSSGTLTKVMDISMSVSPVVFGDCGGTPPSAIPEPYKAYAHIDIPPNAPAPAPDYQNSRYLLRLRGLYKTSRVNVVGVDNAGKVVQFKDSQVSIDATARVGDVVQRVHVRIPSGAAPRNLVPNAAIHASNGICKQLETQPGFTRDNCISSSNTGTCGSALAPHALPNPPGCGHGTYGSGGPGIPFTPPTSAPPPSGIKCKDGADGSGGSSWWYADEVSSSSTAHLDGSYRVFDDPGDYILISCDGSGENEVEIEHAAPITRFGSNSAASNWCENDINARFYVYLNGSATSSGSDYVECKASFQIKDSEPEINPDLTNTPHTIKIQPIFDYSYGDVIYLERIKFKD